MQRDELAGCALEAIEKGNLARASDMARAAGGPGLAARIAEALPPDAFAGLLLESPVIAGAHPEAAERALEDPRHAARARASVVARFFLHADPRRARRLLERDLDLTRRGGSHLVRAAEALAYLAVIDPGEARRRADPWQTSALPPEAAEGFAIAAIEWDPDEGAKALQRSVAKDRLARTVSRVLARWGGLSGRALAPDALLPLLRLIDRPNVPIDRHVERLLWASFDVPPSSLERLVYELGDEAAGGLDSYVATVGPLFPERILDLVRALPEGALARLAPAVVAAARAAGESSPFQRLGIARRFPKAAALGRFRALCRQGAWDDAMRAFPELPEGIESAWLLTELAGWIWREKPEDARRLLGRLVDELVAIDESTRRSTLLDVTGLAEVAPDVAAWIVRDLPADDASLMRPSFLALARGDLFDAVFAKAGPGMAGLFADGIVHASGAWDERAERLLDKARPDPDGHAAALAALAKVDPERAFALAAAASEDARPGLLGAVVEADADARAFDARLDLLDRAVARGEAPLIRGALYVAASRLGPDRLGEPRVARTLETLGRASDAVLSELEPHLGIFRAFELTNAEVRRRYAALAARARAGQPAPAPLRALPREGPPRCEAAPAPAPAAPPPPPPEPPRSFLGRAMAWLGGGAAAKPAIPARRAPGTPRARLRLDPTFGDATARALRRELSGGEFRETAGHLARTRDWDDRAFYVDALSEWQGDPPVFDAWVEAQPRSAEARLLRGAHLIEWAWEARGGGAGSEVTAEGRTLFIGRLEAAVEDLSEAARLDPEDPTPHGYLVQTDIGLESPLEVARGHFEEARRRASDHPIAHREMLTRHCLKWGGSHEQMFRFAREAAKKAPDGSPLHALVVRAHIERWLFQHAFQQDEAAAMYFARPEVGDEIRAAWSHSLGSRTFRERKLTVVDRNWFAFAFYHLGEDDLTRQLFDAIADRPTRLPWGFFSHDPLDAFCEIRDAL